VNSRRDVAKRVVVRVLLRPWVRLGRLLGAGRMGDASRRLWYPRARPDAGAVTAETAAALPAVAVVAAALVGVGHVAMAQLQCLDAARASARLAARGESGGAVSARAVATAPPGATVAVSTSGAEVTVSVAAAVALPLGFTVPVLGRAVADAEPAPDPPP
jgi:hypothetical protein